MWTLGRLAVACAGIVAMLGVSGCSGSEPKPDATASADGAANATTVSPNAVDPTIPIATSQAAGIPTTEPKPPKTPDPTMLDALVLITLATVDPDTGGLLLGGYVSGVAEDGGDCEYTVTSASGESLTIHTEGVENNGSTSCGSTTVAASRVPAGSYKVILQYANVTGQVKSDTVEVEVP